MDLEQRIKKELHISKMPIDAILKTARPIWEVMGISEEKYFDLYMVLEDPRNTPEQQEDKEEHEIAENVEQLPTGEVGEDVQAAS